MKEIRLTERTKNELTVYAVIIIALVIGVLFARTVIKIWHPVLVNGNSMNPTYKSGEILTSTVNFDMENIKKGDVVTFKNEGVNLIKRVVGTPGDRLYIKDGLLFVNDKADPELQYELIEHAGVLADEITLSEDEYFCMGDNRNNSVDCRAFGPIKFNMIENLLKQTVKKGE